MEELLLQNSKNLTEMIKVLKLHEENVARLSSNEDKDVHMNPQYFVECIFEILINPKYKYCLMTREYFQAKDKVVLVRECGHIFKREPFMDWANKTSTCPRCKARLF
jgi:predicted Zn-ribbon and HTH transcriptional regulator